MEQNPHACETIQHLTRLLGFLPVIPLAVTIDGELILIRNILLPSTSVISDLSIQSIQNAANNNTNTNFILQPPPAFALTSFTNHLHLMHMLNMKVFNKSENPST